MPHKTKYKPEFCKRAIDVLRQGNTIYSLCAEFGVGKTTVWHWRQIHPDFDDAVKMGEDLSREWWDQQAKQNLDNPDYNNRMYELQVRNRFNMLTRDKVDPVNTSVVVTTEAKSDSDISKVVELAAKLREERNNLKD